MTIALIFYAWHLQAIDKYDVYYVLFIFLIFPEDELYYKDLNEFHV